jgi:hypothetical protein
MTVLNLYSISMTDESHTNRYFALKLAFVTINEICNKSAESLRLSTLARIASDLGYRETALQALNILFNDISLTNRVRLDEPFLFPSARFDSIKLNNFEKQLPNLVVGSILHFIEINSAYSSYFGGKSSLERLNMIKDHGIVDSEIDRRIYLIKKRFNLF